MQSSTNGKSLQRNNRDLIEPSCRAPRTGRSTRTSCSTRAKTADYNDNLSDGGGSYSTHAAGDAESARPALFQLLDRLSRLFRDVLVPEEHAIDFEQLRPSG